MYAGTNHTHLTELLREREGIDLSRPTVRRILVKAGLGSPRSRRSQQHRVRRQRMPQEGMLVQVDGSHHRWLGEGGPRFALLLTVDDATGTVPAAMFCREEDTPSYFLLMNKLPLPAQAGQGNLQDPQAQRQELREAHRQRDQGERSHRVQHQRPGEAAGRGDGRGGRDQRERLQNIEEELEDVKKRLGRIWNHIETTDTEMADASDRIREHKEKLEIAAEEARALLKERRQFLDSAEMSEFLKTSELTETKAFVGSFVKEVVVKPGRAAIVYSIPTPEDSPIGERTPQRSP